MPAKIRFGPAGWSYADWAGLVYPKPKPRGFDPLEWIAGYFDVVEVNSTFYRPASAKSARGWLERVEHNAEFLFTAKLWRRFTHDRKTAWSRADVDAVREAMDPIHEAGRLGALLLQFPWSFRRTDENREWLGDLVRTWEAYPLVLEVRHTSWNEPQFFDSLRERGIGFVNIDQPLYADSIAPSAHATAPVGYIRVHGRNYRDWWRNSAPHERYDYLYSADELEPWAERAREIAAESPTEDVYVVTNNHFRGKGITNAVMLQSMVEGRRLRAPEGLFEEYGETLRPYADPGPPPLRPAEEG